MAQQPQESKQSLKGRIEAVLFLTGRALSIKDIAEKIGAEFDEVEEALLDLISDFSFREDSALEIDDTDGYILQVKDIYRDVVNKMIPVELTTAALRTLSAIAIHGPILQSALIETRGANAYEHIKELATYKLIYKRRHDRSFMLSVTPKFNEYFKLTGEKNELKRLMATMLASPIQPGEEEMPVDLLAEAESFQATESAEEEILDSSQLI